MKPTMHHADLWQAVDIQTSAQATESLRQIGGESMFAAGIVGTEMLAVPVLAGSAAYAVAGIFRRSSSLGLELKAAKGFYIIIALATLVGVLLDFSPIDPVKAMLWSAAINWVISVPLMIAMMRIATQQKNHGQIRDQRSPEVTGVAGYWCEGCCGIGIWLDQPGEIFQTELVIPLE